MLLRAKPIFLRKGSVWLLGALFLASCTPHEAHQIPRFEAP